MTQPTVTKWMAVVGARDSTAESDLMHGIDLVLVDGERLELVLTVPAEKGEVLDELR